MSLVSQSAISIFRDCWKKDEKRASFTHYLVPMATPTLPEPNVASENGWLGDYFLFGKANSRAYISCGESSLPKSWKYLVRRCERNP